MGVKNRWLVSVALTLGLVQSVLWIVLSVLSVLVYLCVIPISPYKDSGDFLRVTTIKLYFEGPGCIPDGSYLGKFNEDYRNPDVLQLFPPDRVFGIMIAYFILNLGYYCLSIEGWTHRNPKTKAEGKRFSSTLMKWSCLTLIISLVDAVLTEQFILNVISLNNYMGDKDAQFAATRNAASVTIAEISYIPLLLALISSRFVGIWLWNVVVGLIFFFGAMCGRYHVKDPPKNEQKPVKKEEEVNTTTNNRSTTAPLPNSTHNRSIDLRPHSDYANLQRSLEAVTRFDAAPKTIYPKENPRDWSRIPNDSYWSSSNVQSRDAWEMTNEGFVDDDQVQVESQKAPDFDHDLRNFERGPRAPKTVRPPIGKPVRIPRPPPLPPSGCCDC